MKVLFVIITLIVIFNFISNMLNYLSAKRVYKNKELKNNLDKSNFYYIVPIYKEEKIAKEMVFRFYKLSKETNNKTIFVTNIKEVNNVTHNIIEEVIKENKMDDYIKVIMYKSQNGIMAHQINYALDYIDTFDNSDYIVGIFNADSEVNNKHIEFVRNNITSNNVLQGYSYYVNEGKFLINGLVSWQNRWSYIFEAGRCGRRINLFKKMNYVIGHSLYFKSSVIKKVGNIPEDTINEDAFLGVLFQYNDIPVKPIPFFEKASFAPSIKVYIKQQCTWFNGPFQAFKYFRKIKNNVNNNKYQRCCYLKNFKNTVKLFLICFKLFLHAVYWISAIYILFLLYGIVCFKLFDIYGIFYVVIENCLNIVLFNYLSYKEIKKEKKDVTYSLIELPFFSYFIHSLGPILNICKTIMGKNNINNKYKTER